MTTINTTAAGGFDPLDAQRKWDLLAPIVGLPDVKDVADPVDQQKIVMRIAKLITAFHGKAEAVALQDAEGEFQKHAPNLSGVPQEEHGLRAGHALTQTIEGLFSPTDMIRMVSAREAYRTPASQQRNTIPSAPAPAQTPNPQNQPGPAPAQTPAPQNQPVPAGAPEPSVVVRKTWKQFGKEIGWQNEYASAKGVVKRVYWQYPKWLLKKMWSGTKKTFKFVSERKNTIAAGAVAGAAFGGVGAIPGAIAGAMVNPEKKEVKK